MSTKPVNLTMEYSPLNNISSGEEIEQFTLPPATPQHGRPKRRRKRKEFDSLKTHTVHNFPPGPCCHLRNCLLASVIIILFSITCGMAVMLFYVSNTVTEIQERVNSLQVAKDTTSSSFLALRNRFETFTKQLNNMQSLADNHSAELKTVHDQIDTLESKFQTMKADMKNHWSSGKDPDDTQKELAKIESEILALNSEMGSLKDHDKTIDEQLTTLSSSMQSLSSLYQPSPTQSPTDINSQPNILPTTSTGYNNQSMQGTLRNVHEEFSLMNETLIAIEVRVKALESSDCHKICDPLVHRVDSLETYLRKVHEEVEEILTTSFEDRVFNVTMSAGLEDIISRIVQQQTADKTQKLKNQITNLQLMIDLLKQPAATSASTTATPTTAPSRALTPTTTATNTAAATIAATSAAATTAAATTAAATTAATTTAATTTAASPTAASSTSAASLAAATTVTNTTTANFPGITTPDFTSNQTVVTTEVTDSVTSTSTNSSSAPHVRSQLPTFPNDILNSGSAGVNSSYLQGLFKELLHSVPPEHVNISKTDDDVH